MTVIGVAVLVHGGSSNPGVQGSGVPVTQTRAVAGFTSLDLAGSNNVTVVVGARQSVIVDADSNLIGHVTTGVVAGTLVTSRDAAVPGEGAIIYSGNPPQVTTSVTGTGTVTRG